MKDQSNSHPLRVCIIDDDENIVRSFERILATNGHKVLCITSIIGCSQKVNEFDPDIILLDVKMPALDGTRLHDIFRTTLKRMPRIILISGIDSKELKEIAEQINADDFFCKDDDLHKLIQKINYHAFALKSNGKD